MLNADVSIFFHVEHCINTAEGAALHYMLHKDTAVVKFINTTSQEEVGVTA